MKRRQRTGWTWEWAAFAALLPGAALVIAALVLLHFRERDAVRAVEQVTARAAAETARQIATRVSAAQAWLRATVEDTAPLPGPPEGMASILRYARADSRAAWRYAEGPPPTTPLPDAHGPDAWIEAVLPALERAPLADPDRAAAATALARCVTLQAGANSIATRARVALVRIGLLRRTDRPADAMLALDALLAEVPGDAELLDLPLALSMALARIDLLIAAARRDEALAAAQELGRRIAADELPLPAGRTQAHIRLARDHVTEALGVAGAWPSTGALHPHVVQQRSRAEQDAELLSPLPAGTADAIVRAGSTRIDLLAVSGDGQRAAIATLDPTAMLLVAPSGIEIMCGVAPAPMDASAQQATSAPVVVPLPEDLAPLVVRARWDAQLVAERVRPWRLAVFSGSGMVALMSILSAAIAARAVSRRMNDARVRQDLLTAVSHELRTPLTGMMLHLELLEDARVPPAAQRENASRARRAAVRLQGLVERVLQLDRTERADRDVVAAPVAAAELFEAAVDLARRSPGAGALELHIEPGTPELRVDRDAIVQVLIGLLDNAARYAAGAALRLRARPAGPGQVVLEVEDDGPGVPADQREPIFAAFHRLDRDRALAAGSGLGLAIARRIVEAQGGRIHAAAARPGASPEGLRVILELPAALEDEA